MTNYARIQRHIDHGKGKAARHVGQPFIGYRITGTSAGDFPGGWTQTVANFPLLRRRLAETKLEIGIKNVALFYDIVADMGPFLVGDVFLQNDPAYVNGKSYGPGATSIVGTNIEFNAMCLAWHPPENKAVGARLDRRVQIFRPASSPGTIAGYSGATYWKSTHDNDTPLVLSGGTYAFGSAGASGASLIPAGMSSAVRQHDYIFQPGVPGMPKEAKWFAYLPPLPGYMPAEGDALIDENGARYQVVVPFEQKTGVAGYQLAVDRKIASN